MKQGKFITLKVTRDLHQLVTDCQLPEESLSDTIAYLLDTQKIIRRLHEKAHLPKHPVESRDTLDLRGPTESGGTT